ncbi:hypothetical protein [Streptomyces sp. NPDC021608]|uniref:hypothetical protein n=1 Tax=Streptomyces sp. NPDC021608 TaxID=3154903 RepID=UPI0033F27B7B
MVHPALPCTLTTSAGEFRLRPVRSADLPLITEWMNAPAIAAYWSFDGPAERTERHVTAQVYRAELDALARHIPLPRRPDEADAESRWSPLHPYYRYWA